MYYSIISSKSIPQVIPSSVAELLLEPCFFPYTDLQENTQMSPSIIPYHSHHFISASKTGRHSMGHNSSLNPGNEVVKLWSFMILSSLPNPIPYCHSHFCSRPLPMASHSSLIPSSEDHTDLLLQISFKAVLLS